LEEGQHCLHLTKPPQPLSNHHPRPFIIDGVKWKTSQHYLEAQRFNDHPGLIEEIRKCKTAIEVVKLATRNKKRERKD